MSAPGLTRSYERGGLFAVIVDGKHLFVSPEKEGGKRRDRDFNLLFSKVEKKERGGLPAQTDTRPHATFTEKLRPAGAGGATLLFGDDSKSDKPMRVKRARADDQETGTTRYPRLQVS